MEKAWELIKSLRQFSNSQEKKISVAFTTISRKTCGFNRGMKVSIYGKNMIAILEGTKKRSGTAVNAYFS